MNSFFEVAAIGLHLFSVHIPHDDTLNNNNLGAYVRTQAGFELGTYRNSLSRQSTYLGWQWQPGFVNVSVGLVSGYDRRTTIKPCKRTEGAMCYVTTGYGQGRWMPYVVLSKALPEVLGATPRVSYIPGVTATNRMNALHLSMEWSFR